MLRVLGYGAGQLSPAQRFPDLARRIVDLLKSYRAERRGQGEQLLRNAVRSAVIELHATGVYPRHRKVRKKLGSAVFLRDPVAKAKRETARNDLGLVVRTRAFCPA